MNYRTCFLHLCKFNHELPWKKWPSIKNVLFFFFNKFKRENKILELTFNIKVHALLVPTNSTCRFTVISPWIWQLHIFNMQWRFSMLPFDFYTAIWALFTSIQEKRRFYIFIYQCRIYILNSTDKNDWKHLFTCGEVITDS